LSFRNGDLLVTKAAGEVTADPSEPHGIDSDLKVEAMLPAGVLENWYSTKNAVPVIGWIGGNVLKNFRVTFDYGNCTMYWLRQSDSGATDQNQVGLTLRLQAGEYFVAAVATRNGKPTVEGVQAGDKLVRLDGLEAKGAPWAGSMALSTGSREMSAF